MATLSDFSRRSFIASMAAALPLAARAAGKKIPVGLELYSVREGLKTDLMGTVQAVSKMGYECVEFFSPYYEWTPEYAKQVRKELDDLGLKCYSTHNGPKSFGEDGMGKAIELNHILGTHYIVFASAGKIESIDGWKGVAETLDKANTKFKSEGLHAGYHNHALEFKPVDGQLPMEVLAKNTDKSVMLQFDVGTCVEVGYDPVKWITDHPGRIKSMHVKEWSPDKEYRVLFGEGVVPWKKVFAAAESKGGVEYYLIEQEGSDFPENESAERCLVAYRNLHG